MKILLTILIMVGGFAGIILAIASLMWIINFVDKYVNKLKNKYKWFEKLIKILKIVADIILGLFMLFLIFCIGYGIYLRL